jgi:L,D-peptidoglycan transpeptidase YkuD (ErfK/YbiS/YcfS/YnhG family)
MRGEDASAYAAGQSQTHRHHRRRPPHHRSHAQVQAVGAAGTGYGNNGYSAIPSSAGNVAPTSALGQLSGFGTQGYGVPQPPARLGA